MPVSRSGDGLRARLCALPLCTIALASGCDTGGAARDRGDVVIEGQVGRLHVEEAGSGGLPVVLIHAFGGSAAHWSEQTSHLGASRKAIAIDLRGHGESDAPKDSDYRVESLAGDIEVVVDALLPASRFVLVGHSMGGSAAIAYAQGHPERVAGLMLVGAPGRVAPEMAEQVLAGLHADYAGGMESYTNRLLGGAKAEVALRIRDELRRVPRDTSLAIIEANFAYDPLPALQAYAGPTLIVDTAQSEGPTTLHAQAPQIPREVIPGTSHWPQLDDPKRFNNLLDRFLAQIE